MQGKAREQEDSEKLPASGDMQEATDDNCGACVATSHSCARADISNQ